jgi:hypothetical protein
MQIQMSFMDELPIPRTTVWDQLDDEHKALVIECLARLVAKMMLAESNREPNQ